jgi:hypothetical protein
MAKPPADRFSRLAAFDAWVDALPDGLRAAMAARQAGDREGLALGLYWTKAEPECEPDGPAELPIKSGVEQLAEAVDRGSGRLAKAKRKGLKPNRQLCLLRAAGLVP